MSPAEHAKLVFVKALLQTDHKHQKPHDPQDEREELVLVPHLVDYLNVQCLLQLVPQLYRDQLRVKEKQRNPQKVQAQKRLKLQLHRLLLICLLQHDLVVHPHVYHNYKQTHVKVSSQDDQ